MRCNWITGPCVDGTQAGKRCTNTAGEDGRCGRHDTSVPILERLSRIW